MLSFKALSEKKTKIKINPKMNDVMEGGFRATAESGMPITMHSYEKGGKVKKAKKVVSEKNHGEDCDCMKCESKRRRDDVNDGPDVQTEAKVDKGRSDYGKASIRNYRRMGPGHGEPAKFDPENKRGKLIDKRREEHKSRRGVKGAKVPAYKTEEVVAEADKKGKGSGTKDACYHKVKASAKVWPSAYASGRLVQCRKKGASNYGSSKKEEVEYAIEEKKKKKNCGCGKDPCITYGKQEEMKEAKSAAWQRKEGKRESGGLNQKGVDSYRAANPGSKLKTAVTTKPSKLKKGSKSANRRKSFCARMKGMKKRLTSAKTARDPDSSCLLYTSPSPRDS